MTTYTLIYADSTTGEHFTLRPGPGQTVNVTGTIDMPTARNLLTELVADLNTIQEVAA